MESDGGNDEGRFIRGQFDSNGDGVFGDNSKMLNAGAFTINARDTVPENATITSTDANDAATGQFALPIYSWKGSYSLPTGSSVQSVAALFLDLLPTYGAVSSGNLTTNGTAAVHTTIGLFWCGEICSGTCDGRKDPGNNPLLDLGFYYHLYPVNPDPPDSTFPPPSVYDSTYAHPDWVDVITTQALRAAEGAFDPFPAIIVEFGTQTTTPRSFLGRAFRKLIGQRPGPAITLDQNHVALVSGNINPDYGGEAVEGHSPSWVYYGTAMNVAQPNLILTQKLPSDASQSMTEDQDREFASESRLKMERDRPDFNRGFNWLPLMSDNYIALPNYCAN